MYMDDQPNRTYELAGIGERLIAIIIDSIIIGVIAGIIGFSGDLVGGGISSIVLWAGYQWYFLTRQNGQTLGKMVMGLRVIKANGTRIDDADAIVRYVGYYIGGVILFLGFVWAIFDADNQALHDKLAGTYVVKAQKEKAKNGTITV